MSAAYKAIEPAEIRPRSEPGIDHGVEGIVLVRRKRGSLRYLWEPGHLVWAGVGCERRYHCASVRRYEAGGVCFGVVISEGRFNEKARIMIMQDFVDQTGVQIDCSKISKKHTLVVDV